MRQLATTLLIGAATAGHAAAADTPPGLAAAGWTHGTWHGIPPANWSALPGGGVAVRGEGQGSFVWRPASGAPACLTWRWRVMDGPPPQDLLRRGTDRAVSIVVGFSGFPPEATLAQRSRHAVAAAAAGGKPVPRSGLVYVWGGTGQEPAIFPSPYAHGLAKIRVLRPATARRGEWLVERVDLGADWRAAFGGDPPGLTDIAISTDGDDSRSRVHVEVADLRLGACG
jgi:hypothetical protein